MFFYFDEVGKLHTSTQTSASLHSRKGVRNGWYVENKKMSRRLGWMQKNMRIRYFEFMLSAVLWYEILSHVSFASKPLENSFMELLQSLKKIKSLAIFINNYWTNEDAFLWRNEVSAPTTGNYMSLKALQKCYLNKHNYFAYDSWLGDLWRTEFLQTQTNKEVSEIAEYREHLSYLEILTTFGDFNFINFCNSNNSLTEHKIFSKRNSHL